MSSPIILKGNSVAKNIKKELHAEISKLLKKNIIPKLVAILIGDDPASKIYINSKHKTFVKNRCLSDVYTFDKDVKENKVISFINKLNKDNSVHGILIQLPLPKKLNEQRILKSIDPNKDVDGFHPTNLGYLLSGNPRFIPCTPFGCLKILEYYNINVNSKHVVILGRSNIVGKPLLALLSQKFEIGNATVTICHTGTKNIPYYTKQADILIVAIGQPNFITSNMVKKGVHIIDVGINRIQNNVTKKGYIVTGDVDYNGLLDKVQSITPVPGGVGPMTITMLLKNTIKAALLINS